MDTEVPPRLRKRRKKLNEVEKAMELAGLYPEDPDRETKKEETKKRKAKEKTERPWEGTRASKKAKQNEYGNPLWDKWKSRMAQETDRWSTQ